MGVFHLQSYLFVWPSKELCCLFLPIGMLLAGISLFGLRKKEKRVLVSYILSVWVFFLALSAYLVALGLRQPFQLSLDWFDIGRKIRISFGLDHPGTLMLGLVVGVTFLVTVYSFEYMKAERGFARYFACLFIFSTSMLGIVLSFNLLLTFVFWELVGFSSYLLINFWYDRLSANEAARKAFILNRIGDLGFVFGLGLLYAQFGTFELDEIKYQIADGKMSPELMCLSGVGLFFGCVGKSAQFPLLVWLPDAMQAPTPVSALLHAATMVAAGVFLMARIMPILPPEVMVFVAYTGAITSLIGAFSAACQTDIKKILAYSTISQLGYMMAGLGAHSPFASLFHLFTHALFKASLFLAAGAIIHAMSHLKHRDGERFDPQDIRLMGGLRKRMPFTFSAFLLACLAGAGVPLSAGFLSKDEILTAVCAWASMQSGWVHWILPILVLCTSFMTAFYLGRMFFLIFFGGFRLGKSFPSYRGASQKLHEPPLLMRIPYCLLSLFSLFVFFSFNPIDPDKSWLVSFLPSESSAYGLEQSFLVALKHKQEAFHYGIISVSIVVLSLGFGLSYVLYAFKTRYKIEFLKRGIRHNWLVSLSLHGLFLDSLYAALFVKPFGKMAMSVSIFDKKYVDKAVEDFAVFMVVFSNCVSWIDRFLVDGMVNAGVWSIGQTGKQLRYMQNGKIQTYLFIGISVFVGLLVWLLIV